jgi:hydroxymethylglutaryl-CoA lyase
LTDTVTLVESPRDAWLGVAEIIPAGVKANFLLKLEQAGVQHMDAVGFVPPSLVKQMADSAEVMRDFTASLNGSSRPEVIAVAVDEPGMRAALATPGVSALSYPYSVSAYYRRASANMTRGESRAVVEKIRNATKAAGHGFMVSIAMAFGNPYEEPWGPEIVEDTLVWLKDAGVHTVTLVDTMGKATADEVHSLYEAVKSCVAGVEIGVHLHARPEAAAEKILAAYAGGCRRFDCALTGLGTCPMAGDDQVGNIPTETILEALAPLGADLNISRDALAPTIALANDIREKYGLAKVK